MKKRFLAMLLCLSVLLMACACAAETEAPVVSTPEHKEHSPQFTLSEVNAESSTTQEPAAPSETAPAESEPQGAISMEESDISLEPIQPIEPVRPIVPEEKETTLEFLKEFPVGENGIVIAMNYHSDATYAFLESPSQYFADEDGNVYYFWHDFFFNLQTGEKLRIPYSTDFFSAITAYNGKIYGITESGKLQTYSFEEGLLSTVQIGSSGTDNTQVLFVQSDGTIAVKKQGKLYDVNGKVLSDFPVQYTKEDGATDGVLTVYGKPFVCKNYGGLLSGGMNIFTAEKRQFKVFKATYSIIESLYTQYGTNGDVLSQFKLMDVSNGERKECSIFDGYGKECKYYWSRNVIIGKHVFEGVLSSELIQSADNTLYLMLLYPDHGELYRVVPGYSDIGLSNLDEMTLEDLMDPMEETSVGSSLLSAANETSSSTVLHVPLDRDTTERRANYVINTPWVLTDEHQYVRSKHSDHVVFPKFIQDAVEAVNSDDFSITLIGIPYCVGGMNGYETFDSSNYLVRSFYDNLICTATDGHAYTVGNTGDTWLGSDGVGDYELIPRTVGLDCSGFLGSTCGVETKRAPEKLRDYGHLFDDMSQLERCDFLIEKDNSHCLFFIEFLRNESGITGVRVQDCTRTMETGQKTSTRTISLEEFALLDYYDPYYTFLTNASSHAYYCSECDPDVNINNLEWTAHEWELVSGSTGHWYACVVCNYYGTVIPHTFTYTYSNAGHIATCTDCGYTVTATHSMGYTGYDANGHTRSCSCGYSVTQAHTMLPTHTPLTHGASCSCGYSVAIAHVFTYQYNETTHWQACACGYTKGIGEHDFESGRCRICNARQVIIAALPPEDEPLPVPEDQKATL